MNNKARIQYWTKFKSAKDFAHWVETMHYNYTHAMSLRTFENAEYQLIKLHDEFGTTESKKLVEIIYEESI
jgi:hypothetical protein